MEWPFTLSIAFVVWTTTALTSSWLLFQTLKSYLRLRHIPGPPLAAWSRWWMITGTAAGTLPFKMADASRIYGSLIRIGPNDLATNDLDILRQLNAAKGPFQRSEWYKSTAMSHSVNHTFAETAGDRHKERRNKLIAGYASCNAVELERQLDLRVHDMCELIRDRYTSDDTSFQPVDIARISSYLTLDVIYSLLFGSPMGFLETDSDVDNYIATQQSMLAFFEYLGTIPFLERLMRVPFISKRVMPMKTDKTGVGLIMKHVRNEVNVRHEKPSRDIITSLLENGLTDDEAEQDGAVTIITGSDSTATTIRMALYFLTTNPHAYRKLQDEINTAHRAGKISKPVIQESETQDMPYLHACVRETMRLYPPIAGLFSKVVPSEGAMIAGKFIPGGTKIAWSGVSLQHSTEIFGPDATIFRPERWLNGSSSTSSQFTLDIKDLPEMDNEQEMPDTVSTADQKLKRMRAANDTVFGNGKNSCVGKPIALMEIRKAVTELLRRFEVSIVQPEKGLDSKNRNGLYVQKNMFMRFEKKDNDCLD